MKIKKNTFCTLVLELVFPSTANCRKLKIQKNPKIDFPYCSSTEGLTITGFNLIRKFRFFRIQGGRDTVYLENVPFATWKLHCNVVLEYLCLFIWNIIFTRTKCQPVFDLYSSKELVKFHCGGLGTLTSS
jgi:hypothetical protein